MSFVDARHVSAAMAGKRTRVILMMSLTFVMLHSLVTVTDSSEAPNITYRLSEDTPIGTQIGDVMLDSGLSAAYSPTVQSQLTFSFSSTSSIDFLAIDRKSGVIRVSTVIDRSSICPYVDVCQLSVDVLVTSIFKVIQVLIVLLSANRHSPSFPVPITRINVTANAAPGSTWTLPEADDPDGGVDGVQSYQLTQLSPAPLSSPAFTLVVVNLPDGSDDVRLKLMTSLDRRLADSYAISVVAVDGGRPPKNGSMIVYVNVIEDTDNGLQFGNASYDVTIDENVALSTIVTKVTATTRRPGAVIGYTFDAYTQQMFGQMFAINNDTGVIYVVGPVDAEAHANCMLTVVATDRHQPGSLPVYTRVVVNIRNVNDNPPQVSISTLTSASGSTDGAVRGDVADGAPIGTFIAYVGVSDADDSAANAVECSINSTLFSLERLDVSDYQLISAVVFDRGHDPLYPVAIACHDGGDGRLPVLDTVKLIDVIVVDSGPRFATSSTVVRIFAGSDPPGAFVAHLNATNTDVGPEAEISYSMSSNMSQSLLSIDARTGVVTTRLVFGPGTVNQTYVFYVIAVDQGSPPLSANTTLTIQVVGSHAVPVVPEYGTTTPTVFTAVFNNVIMNTTHFVAAVAASTDNSLRDVIIISAVVSVGVVLFGCTFVVITVICCCRRRKLPKSVEVQRGAGPQICTVDITRTESVTPTDVPDIVHNSSLRMAVDSYATLSAMSTNSDSFKANPHQTMSSSDRDPTSSCLRPVTAGRRPTELRHPGWSSQRLNSRSTSETDVPYVRTTSNDDRPPRPGFTTLGDLTVPRGAALRSPHRTSPRMTTVGSPDSKSPASRIGGDPAESDSGCSGSLPDSRRGLGDEGDRWVTSSSGQSINTATALTTLPSPTSDVSSGSYSPTRAAQFLSLALGQGMRESSFYRSCIPRFAVSDMQQNRPIVFSKTSAIAPPSECKRTTARSGQTAINCDTYV